jgi:hypothetical protein
MGNAMARQCGFARKLFIIIFPIKTATNRGVSLVFRHFTMQWEIHHFVDHLPSQMPILLGDFPASYV